jgi:yeast amino acid transporter
MVRRWDRRKDEDDYPYRSHGQPFTAYAALTSCLFLLIVANGASLWKEWNINAFLSAYLAVS